MGKGPIEQVPQHCISHNTDGEVAYIDFPLLLVGQGKVASSQCLQQ